MNLRVQSAGRLRQFLSVVLAATMATGPSVAAVAQVPREASAAAPNQLQRGGPAATAGQPRRGAPATTPRQPQAAAPAAAARQPQTGAPAAAPRQPVATAPAAGAIDTSWVVPDADGIVVFRPAQIMTSPNCAMLPLEVATAAGIQYLGIDPANVEEVIAFAKQPANLQPPEYGIAIKFNKPFRGGDIPQGLRAHTQVAELAGRKYLQSTQPMLPSLFAPDGMTLVVAPEATLKRLVEKSEPSQAGALLTRVRSAPGGSDLYAAVDLASLRPLILGGLAMAQMQAGQNIPPEMQRFFQAPNLISAAELTLNMSRPGTSSLIAHANDDASATQLDAMIGDAVQMYKSQMDAQFAQQEMSSDPVEKAFASYMKRVSAGWTDSLRPQRSGASLTLFSVQAGENSPQQQMTTVAVGGILVALLLPAIQAAREAARRNQSMSQLKQLTLALLNYESATKRLPAHATYDVATSQPLLSWRVQILPYLGEEALYREFHLNEPWDSEHNRPLIAKMPAAYANPNLPFPPTAGKTNFLAAVGEPCVMKGTPEGVSFGQISDGMSMTIVLVEANAEQAVEWTKPEDLKFDPQNPAANLGGLRPGGWNAAFCDGHIQFISNNIDPQVLKAMFTRNGREVIGQDALMGGPPAGFPQVPMQGAVPPTPPAGAPAAAPAPVATPGGPAAGGIDRSKLSEADKAYLDFFGELPPKPEATMETRGTPENPERGRSGR